MSHDSRPASRAWLAEHGATVDDPRAIRRKVVAARGEHELEAGDRRAVVAGRRRRAASAAVAARRAHTPRTRASSSSWPARYDAAGDEAEAIGLYGEALAAGLRSRTDTGRRSRRPRRLRNLGDHEQALALLDEVDVTHPGNVAVAAFRALVLVDAGRAGEAVADLVDALVDHAADEDAAAYRRSLHAYATTAQRGARGLRVASVQ